MFGKFNPHEVANHSFICLHVGSHLHMLSHDRLPGDGQEGQVVAGAGEGRDISRPKIALDVTKEDQRVFRALGP